MEVGRRRQRTNIGRRLEILSCIVDHEAQRGEGLSVTAVSAALHREKSQISRGLRALAVNGLVVREPDSLRYVSGSRLLDLAAHAGDPDLLKRARPAAQRLATSLGERVQICVLVDGAALTVETATSTAPVQVVARIGMKEPLHCTAAGRALLFDADDATVRTLITTEQLEEGVAAAPHTYEQLYARLDEERRAGIAVAVGELTDDVAAIAAPIRTRDHRVVAALAIAGPRARLTAAIGAAGTQVRSAAGAV
jgi:DNA-binding IclR family transcriptional regulator